MERRSEINTEQTKAEPSAGKGSPCACVTRVIPAAGDCAQERLRDTATAVTVVTEPPEYLGTGQTQPLPGCGLAPSQLTSHSYK